MRPHLLAILWLNGYTATLTGRNRLEESWPTDPVVRERSQTDLVQGCHPGHVDPVQINVHAGSPQHVHDGVPIALLDVILEHHLVRESDSSLARVEPGEDTGSS